MKNKYFTVICSFRSLKARGQVEQWLSNLELTMYDSVKACLKKALPDYSNENFMEWVLGQYGQISLIVILIAFTSDVEGALKHTTQHDELDYLVGKVKSKLDVLAEFVKKRMQEYQRNTAVALIIALVHGRDIVDGLGKAKLPIFTVFPIIYEQDCLRIYIF